MKRFLGLFLGLCFFILSGCSSVTVPEGVDSDVYSSWKNYKQVHEEVYSPNSREQVLYYSGNLSFLDNNYRNNCLTFQTESQIEKYYTELIGKANRILDLKSEYETTLDVLKNHGEELKTIRRDLSKVIKYNFNNNSKWSTSKFGLEYLEASVAYYKERQFDEIEVEDMLKENIFYDIKKQRYEVFVKFEHKNVEIVEKVIPMTNAFGVKVSVKEKTYLGTGLSTLPLQTKFYIPMEINLAKKYPTKDLSVDLYFVLTSVFNNFKEEKATLKNTNITNDFRTIYNVKILGYDLKYKDNIILSENFE